MAPDRTRQLSRDHARQQPGVAVQETGSPTFSARKTGYRGLVVSDEIEGGGVLKAAPIERAAVEQIAPEGADLCLRCHIEEYVTRSYEALIQEAESSL